MLLISIFDSIWVDTVNSIDWIRIYALTNTYTHTSKLYERNAFISISIFISLIICHYKSLSISTSKCADSNTKKKHTTLNIFNLSPLVHTHGARRECMKLSLIENSIVETFGSHVITYFVCIYLLFVHFIFYVWL